ncbi:MAG: hypothetical protein HC841_03415 [Verrucomicrobiae bacterium]|nr:hypothetical protein [Verrucomicrobiae bacterium]
MGGVLLAALFTLTVSSPFAFAEKGAELLMRNAGGGGLNIRSSRPLSRVESTSTELPASRRVEWLAAGKRGDLYAKQLLAEEIGEEATRIVARERRHAPLLAESELPHHGPDWPTIDDDGVIHVYESKGGSSPLKSSRGHLQGTPENAVEFYYELHNKQTASMQQREVARKILKCASEGKLVSHVVRGLHDNGKPTSISISEEKMISAQTREVAARYVREIDYFDELARSVAANRRVEARNAKNSKMKAASKRLLKAAGPVGFAVEVADRGAEIIETEVEFSNGLISAQARGELHAENAAGAVGGTAGAYAGAKLGAVGGAILGPPGMVAGGIAGGIAGYVVGDKIGSEIGSYLYYLWND